MIVCSVQQSEPAIHTHPSLLFWVSFPFRSPRSTELSSLCRRGGSPQASVVQTQSCVCVSPDFPSIPPLRSAWHPCVCSLCRFKGMMELQLCLEKSHCLDRWSMNINGAWCDEAQMRMGDYQKGAGRVMRGRMLTSIDLEN